MSECPRSGLEVLDREGLRSTRPHSGGSEQVGSSAVVVVVGMVLDRVGKNVCRDDGVAPFCVEGSRWLRHPPPISGGIDGSGMEVEH